MKHNCTPGLNWLYKVDDYVTFFKSLRPSGHLLVATIAGPTAPVEVEVTTANPNPTLKHSCSSSSLAGSGDPAIRMAAVMTGLGANGLFNLGVSGSGTTEVNICSTDFSAALQLIGQRTSQWY